MVAATKDSTAPSQPSAAPPEEDALKRNTDCVYFLASPLTCKKGSECEYRHSEHARMNPRDCWFWLNGNCLNPKCSFRHPPLDGLLGTQATTPSGSSIPTSHSSGKQSVPCIFFQKGLCLKGDRCAFLHGPNPTGNKIPQAPAATPGTEPPSLKKVFGGLEKCTQEQRVLQPNFSKSFEMITVFRMVVRMLMSFIESPLLVLMSLLMMISEILITIMMKISLEKCSVIHMAMTPMSTCMGSILGIIAGLHQRGC
ncbi:unnamed protein product, partial [Vitis vinifera]